MEGEFERQHSGFKQTHWSLVLAAGSSNGGTSSLEKLLTIYWPPIFGFLRRSGYSIHDAQDLTQEFFARLIERQSISKVDPVRGKFRTFLLHDLNFMLLDRAKAQNRQKRGSGATIASLAAMEAEDQRYEPAGGEMDPAEWYDFRWRMAFLDQVLVQLKAEFESAGKGHIYSAIHPFLTDRPDEGQYATIATQFGLSEGNVAVMVHRMRSRFRELVTQELSHTVESEEDLKAELSFLFKPH